MEAAAAQNYEDFEPSTEIVEEKDCDTLLVHVPGFKKEKLRVQLTSDNFLSISGEREIQASKYKRFQKQFPVSSNYDKNRITAKFEKGILYLRLPKLITQEDKTDNKLLVPQSPAPEMPADKPQPQKIANEPQSQTNAQQQTAEKASPSDGSNKQASEPKEKAEKITETPDSASLAKNFQTAEKASPSDGSNKQASERKEKAEKITETPDSASLAKNFEEKKPETDAAGAADRVGKGSRENVDASGKAKLDNYKEAAVDPSAKLKMSRRAFYVVLVVLSAVGLGLYFSNFIRSFRRTEISG